MNVVFKRRMREAFFTFLLTALFVTVCALALKAVVYLFVHPLVGLGVLIGWAFVYALRTLWRHR